ncbi:hypothetical protein [Hahella ganghwensis]|uniref:hypothetical protein n=1 Tax=Hahella ganghwensis TaxID=286420 RepID=UPI00037032FB|nr:hypothetical protein [Hahella ganghwensis]
MLYTLQTSHGKSSIRPAAALSFEQTKPTTETISLNKHCSSVASGSIKKGFAVFAMALAGAAVSFSVQSANFNDKFELDDKKAPETFEEYRFDNPLRQAIQSGQLTEEQAKIMRGANFPEFARLYFPKITIPVEREKFRGIWRYYDHDSRISPSDDKSCYVNGQRYCSTYDGSLSRPVYDSHAATDFWTSFIDFGKQGDVGNYLVNPFPEGAVTYVTKVAEGIPDCDSSSPSCQHLTGSGNSLVLKTYLNKTPDDCAKEAFGESALQQCIDDIPSWSIAKLEFFHLECGTVMNGDVEGPARQCEQLMPTPDVPIRVNSLQRLARIGYSGEASLRGSHIHMYLSGMSLTDPFAGPNNPVIKESLFFDQSRVERLENYASNGDMHFRVNGTFFPQIENQAVNEFTFTSLSDIRHLWVVEAPNGALGNLGPADKVKMFDLLEEAVIDGDPVVTSRMQADRNGKEYRHYTVKFTTKKNLLPYSGEWGVVAENSAGKTSNTVYMG